MTGTIFLETGELSVGEANGIVFVPIVRSGDLTGTATIEYGITADTAASGVDYVGGNGTITMAAGQDRVSLPVQILNDNLSEPTEAFVVSIVNVDSGSTLLFPRTARVDILDNENPVVDPPSPPLTSNYNVTRQAVISGLSEPMAFEFAPQDQSLIYVAEKAGTIKVVDLDTGALHSTFVNITAKVNSIQDRGLVDIALHPDFPQNPYVYAFYVVDPPDTVGKTGNAGPDGGGNRFAYVVRFTADVATNYTTAVPGSEVILVGGAGQTLQNISGGGAVDSTSNFSQPESGYNAQTGQYVDDYIKVDSRSHTGGSLAFGPDGALYVSIGDGTSFNAVDPRAVSVQNINSLSGKILRIDPLTGLGLPDNPFVHASDLLSANHSKVYQLGLRNPFSMGFDQDGHLFITNTGWNSWEEIESGNPGANFGWPYFEGGDNGVLLRAPGYQNLSTAAPFYAAVANGTITITPAYRAFGHAESEPGFQNQAITGGDVFYSGSRYPAEFQNDFFFTDIVDGEVFSVDVNDRRDVKFLFGTQEGPVHFSQGPDGYVYVANLLSNTISRLLIEPLQPTTSTVLYRVNAGGPQVAAIDGGPAWAADTASTPSSFLAVLGSNSTATNAAVDPGGTVAPTTAPTIFDTERWDSAATPEMQWAFPVPIAGLYEVRLFMGNGYAGTALPGQRVFDVSIEGAIPSNLDNVDLSQRFGNLVGGQITNAVQVTDGVLNIQLIHGIENPLINGIEIVQLGTGATAPTITSATDDVSPVTGTVSPGGSTDDTTPTFTGTAAAGSTVTLYDTNGTTVLGTGTATGGTWTITTSALGEGTHSVTAKATDAGGNQGPASTAYAVMVDTTAPGTPTITSASDDVGPVTGTVSSGGSTDDATPTFTGTAEAGSTVTLYDTNGTTVLGSGTATGGSWTITTSALSQATHSVTAKATDAAGNQGPASTAYAVTVTPPPAVTVLYRVNAGGPQVAAIDGGPAWAADTASTPSSFLAVLGSNSTATNAAVDPGGTVAPTTAPTIFDTERWDSAATPEMQWAFPVPIAGLYEVRLFMGNGYAGTALPGQRVFDVSIEGAIPSNLDNVDLSQRFGNLVGGQITNAVQVTDGVLNITFIHGVEQPLINGIEILQLGTGAPNAPTITSATDDVLPVTGTVSSGGSTNDATPTFTGTAAAGSTVTLYDTNGTTVLGTGTATGGSWTITTSALSQGTHSVTAKATVGGNQGPASTAYAVTVDTTAPGTPTITSATDNVGPVTGTVSSGGSTDDATPTFTGTAAAGSTVTLYDTNGTTVLGSGTATGGSWTITTSALSQATHSVTAKATDAAGNQGPASTAYAVTVTVSNPGPVAAYGFNETSGTTTVDATGNGLTGTLTNGPVFTTGHDGNAIRLDGINDFVNLGNPAALQLTGSMTISAWINSSAFPGDDAAIVSKRSAGVGFQLDTTIDKGPRTIGFKLTKSSAGSMYRYGTTALQANTWYYVTGVYDAAAQTIHVYLNGQLDDGASLGTVTSTQQNSTVNVSIGQNTGAPGAFPFNGLIDDVRIYSRALTQAEIQIDMNTSVGGTSSVTATASSLESFTIASDGQSGTTLIDPSASAVAQNPTPAVTISSTGIGTTISTTIDTTTQTANTNFLAAQTSVAASVEGETMDPSVSAVSQDTTVADTTSPGSVDTSAQAANTRLLVDYMASTLVASTDAQTVTSTVDPMASTMTQTPTLTHPLAA